MAIGIYNRYVPYERSIENIEELLLNDESLLEERGKYMDEIQMIRMEEELCPVPCPVPILEAE